MLRAASKRAQVQGMKESRLTIRVNEVQALVSSEESLDTSLQIVYTALLVRM